MPTTFVKGDFLNEVPKGGIRAFACPVDASGNLDVGVAVAVAKRWPEFATWWTERSQKAQLGDAVAWTSGDDLVYALVMQRRGAKAKVSWLERAVDAMVKDAAGRKVETVNVPRLWGGATGLDGDRSKRVISEVTLTSPVAVSVFEQFIRNMPKPQPEPEPEPDDSEEDLEAPKPKAKSKSKAKSKKKAAATKAKPKAKAKAAAPKPKKKATAKRPATKKKNKPGG